MPSKNSAIGSHENQLAEYIFEIVEEHDDGPSPNKHKILILADNPGGSPGDFERFIASSLEEWFQPTFSVTLLNPNQEVFGSIEPHRFY